MIRPSRVRRKLTRYQAEVQACRDGQRPISSSAVDATLDLLKEVTHKPARAQFLLDLGEACLESKAFERAQAIIEQALELFAELENRLGEGRAHDRLASIYESQDRLDEAISSSESALKCVRDMGDDARLGAGIWTYSLLES